jgi:hypothetical protein
MSFRDPHLFDPLIPAKAGTQAESGASFWISAACSAWVPAFAGMSGSKGVNGTKGQRP